MSLHIHIFSGGFWPTVLEAVLDCLTDSLKMLPLLFLAYLLMEYLEKKTGDRMDSVIRKVGKAGPLLGALLGAVPQCGFSGAIAGLYCGGLTTLGTLLAVFLSTSDEMIPLLLAGGAPVLLILKLVGCKVLIGILFGYLIDLLLHTQPHAHIEELCEQDHPGLKEPGILVSALRHTLKTLAVILIVSLALDLLFDLGGSDLLSRLLPDVPVIQESITGLIGLIPSCSASVFLTQLYTQGVLEEGALLTGLCTNAGIGLLVLFRQNRHTRNNLLIVALLYVCGVAGGLITGMFL